MKKSVKKVLAALLSVLLFASLFTTTAFAATPSADDVASARQKLNDAVDSLYNTAKYMPKGMNVGDLAAYINSMYLDKAESITNAYTIAAYNSMTAHVQEFQGNLATAIGNMYGNIFAWLNNIG